MRRLAELEITSKHVQRLAERLGRERLTTREAAVTAHKAGELSPRYLEPPDVVAIHLDAGKLQARAADGAPGVHEPHWRDDKVACLATYPDVSYAEDPRPTPPAAFLDPPRVMQLCAELARGRSGDSAVPSPPPTDVTIEPSEQVAEQSPRPLVRTAVATLANSDAFGWLSEKERPPH